MTRYLGRDNYGRLGAALLITVLVTGISWAQQSTQPSTGKAAGKSSTAKQSARTNTTQASQAPGGTRTEKDLLGPKQIPADAYYGVQTARALETFQLSGVSINRYPEFIEAWAIVKLAAAQANTDVGAMKQNGLPVSRKLQPRCGR